MVTAKLSPHSLAALPTASQPLYNVGFNSHGFQRDKVCALNKKATPSEKWRTV